jgi:hypothetical protein
VWSGPPFSDVPTRDSCSASPSRQAQTAVSSVEVSKPISARSQPSTTNLKSPTRLPSTNQVTLCSPGMFEVILLT